MTTLAGYDVMVEHYVSCAWINTMLFTTVFDIVFSIRRWSPFMFDITFKFLFWAHNSYFFTFLFLDLVFFLSFWPDLWPRLFYLIFLSRYMPVVLSVVTHQDNNLMPQCEISSLTTLYWWYGRYMYTHLPWTASTNHGAPIAATQCKCWWAHTTL